MEATISYTTIVNLCTFSHGILLAGVLLYMNNARRKSTFYLGLFVLIFSVELLPMILRDFDIEWLKNTSYFPVSLNWFLFPLFFLYVQKVSIFSGVMRYWPIYGALIGILLEFGLFLLDTNGYSNTIVHYTYTVLVMGYDTFIGIHVVIWINRHIKEVANQYSFVGNKELTWAKNYAIIGVAYILLSFTVAQFGMVREIILYFSIANMLLLYWVSLRGLVQQNVEFIVPLEITPKNKKVTSTVLVDAPQIDRSQEFEQVIRQVSQYLHQSQDFTKIDLTITDVSMAIDIHPKLLSSSMNQQLETNFNRFINDFRVEKAVSMLKDNNFSIYSIEGIGTEAGFNSRSVFYSAFKQKMGMTPNQYRKKIN